MRALQEDAQVSFASRKHRISRHLIARFLLIAVSVLMVAVSCNDAVTAPSETPVPLGSWAGFISDSTFVVDDQTATLTVRSNGADVLFQCGGSNIETPLLLDGAGRFTVHGILGLQIAKSLGFPARFEGQVSGDTMVLVVIAPIWGSRTFVFQYGATAKVGNCPRR